MKILALSLLLAAAPILPSVPPKPVTIYLFVQCREPLYLMFVASDGSSRVIDFEETELLRSVLAQLPKEQKLRVTLPDPENGCPLIT